MGALRSIVLAGKDAFVSDEALRAQAERHLQVAIQSAIDVGTHILAEDSAATPDDYGSAFELLVPIHVIDGELARRLRRASGLRNILVHAYVDVEPGRLWDELFGLDDLVSFAHAVEGYLSR